MSEVPDVSGQLKSIASSIDSTFSELMALVVKKTLTKLKSCDFRFSFDHEALGWTNDSLASFRVRSKGVKVNVERSKMPFYQFDQLLSRAVNTKCCNNGAPSFLSDVYYGDILGQLEGIGHDIIKETDPSLCPTEAATLPTAALRARLYDLESQLAEFSVRDPELFDAYLEMIRLINSVPKNKIVWIINLISALSYEPFDRLPNRGYYLQHLGEEFIHVFLDNPLVVLLLQSNVELIISLSYIYPLFKLLFVTFGYARLSPVIIIVEQPRIFDPRKNRGAYIRRGGDVIPTRCTQPVPANELADPIPEAEYAFIEQFRDLYPILLTLIGGDGYPEDAGVNLDMIPPNYDLLPTISDYLWRFNDYSHCKRAQRERRANVKQLSVKVSDKVKLIMNA